MNLNISSTSKKLFALAILLLLSLPSVAQQFDLSGGIDEGNTAVRSLIPNLKYLLWGIASVIGIFGSIKVYSKFHNNDQDAYKAVGQYGFAFIFLLGAGFIIDTAFGL